MRTLSQLIRLHRHRLLGTQKQVNKLEAAAAELKHQAERLEVEALIEEARAEESQLGLMAFASYFERVIERRFALNEERGTLHQKVLGARRALKDAFQELKRIEILLDQRQEAAEAAEKKAEQSALDEVALNQHRRGS